MRRCLRLRMVSLMIGVAAAPSVAVAQAVPELPRVFLNTTYPTQTGTVRTVPAGGSIQAAVDAAVPGDTIVVQSCATFMGTLMLKWKSNPDGKWIVIRSSSTLFDATGAVRPGTRVNGANTSHTSQMPRIKS